MSSSVNLSEHYAVLEFQGDESLPFLHRQLSCRVDDLTHGSARAGGWLNAQGRVLALGVVALDQSGPLWVVARAIEEMLRQRLQMFVLNADVRIQRRDVPVHGCFGSTTEPPSLNQLPVDHDDHVLRIHWPGGRLIRIGGADSETPSMAALDAWLWHDIDRGLPWVGDWASGRYVAQMLNLDRLGAIDFSKGCYPGQEIVARTRHLGQVKRRTRVLRGANRLVVGAAIYAGVASEHPCGEVLQCAEAPCGRFDVLAVVHQDAWDQETFSCDSADGRIDFDLRERQPFAGL